MGRDEQLLFVAGVPPIFARRIPFWFAAPWGGWVEPNPVEGAYPEVSPEFTLRYGLDENEE